MRSLKKHKVKIVMLQDFFGLKCSYQENLLTEYYVKMGHQVVVITSTFESIFDYVNNKYNPKLSKKTEDYKGGKIIRLPYQLRFQNRFRRHKGVYNILEDEKPDLIFLHGIHLNLVEVARYKNKYSECKIIMDYHADSSNSANNWLSLNILHKVIYKKILHKYIRYIDRFFPVTPSSTQFLNEVYDVPLDKMELLPLGCDHDLSKKLIRDVDKNRLKEKFSIKENDFVIISGGKLDPSKKTNLLITALRVIENKRKIHLIVFGAPRKGYEQYYEHLIESGKDLNIHFTGWLSTEKILELMSISNIAVYPASQSVLWQQSIGMHLPLIVGDKNGQSAEYLNRANNVIVLPKEEMTANNLAIHIQRIMNEPRLEKSMREGAEIVATTFLDYKIICSKTLNVFEH